jgi:hypothetical protein
LALLKKMVWSEWEKSARAVISDCKQRGDRLSAVDAADRFAEQRGDADHMDLVAAGLRYRIGGDELIARNLRLGEGRWKCRWPDRRR